MGLRLPRGSPAFHSPGVSSARCLCSLLTGLALVFATTSPGSAGPAVPGYERLQGTAEGAAQAGQVLLGELNCLSCHEEQGDSGFVGAKEAPDLSAVGARVTPNYLRRFLSEPHAAKPGTTMPDVFHGVDPRERKEEVEALVHFLAGKGGGLKPSKRGGSARLVERGRELFHSVGCVACHAPEEGAADLNSPGVALGDLARKTTVDQLTEFLLDPLKIRRSGRMPDFWLAEGEAHALAVYLLRDQLQVEPAAASRPESGVQWEYFEAPMSDKLPDFESLTPTRSGTHSTITFNMGFQKRRHDFAMRWRAVLRVPKDGKWTFFTVSDDGSQFLINGEVVVDSDGMHTRKETAGSVELKAGDHELEVRYFQKSDSAVFGVGWQGPEMRKQRIPSGNLFLPRGDPMMPVDHDELVVDALQSAKGAQVFAARGCASCHELPGIEAAGGAKSFATLGLEGGCLSESVPPGAPDYDLEESQRSALREALILKKKRAPVTAQKVVEHKLAALNCYACHQRGELGGPDDFRREFFKTKVSIDLGEEGKIPPNLNTVGSKFRREALEKILYHGEMHVRGRYMATRMPGFGKENLEPLVAALVEADGQEGDAEAPEFTYGSARDGQALVGAGGLACITCHNVGGRQAVGIPGIDLAEMQQRLSPGWFRRFMHDPQAFNKDTRMPAFWPDGVASFKKIAEGNTDRQIEGIWNYLSLGKSMPPPAGIAEEGGAGSELKPVLEPIVHRTFMTDVGPRAIVAGFPERVHVAFDANVIRLAKAWRGRFFDASGVASGRSDKFFGPLGTDVYNFPPGPAFTLLGQPDAPWPTAAKTDRDVGGAMFEGYRLTAEGEPVFHYRVGGCLIHEQAKPVLKPGGAVLVRHFTVRADGNSDRNGLALRAAAGQSIEKREDGTWSVDKKATLTIEADQPVQPLVRKGTGGQELIVPLSVASENHLELKVQIKW